MAYIEGISDEFITLFLTLLTIIIVVFSWLSTNVREFPFPVNLLVLERRSRRFYTTTFNGNLNRIIASQRLGTSNTTTNPTLANSTENSQNSLINNNTPSQNVEIPSNSNINSTILDSQNEIVDEIVEQALVENLLEGTLYTASDIEARQNNIITTDTTTRSNESTDTQANTNQDIHPTVEERSNKEILDDDSLKSNEGSSPMNILIRFVNEKEMKIQAKPEDTILLIKRTHFEQELSSNKIVRFIYQGQFLCDKNTIKSYNIKDQTTIHCHITSKQQNFRSEPTTSDNASSTSANRSNLRQRIQNHHISTISRITGIPNNNGNIIPNNTELNADPQVNTGEPEQSTDTSETVVMNDNDSNTTNILSVTNSNTDSLLTNLNDQTSTTSSTIISIELSNFLLPLFAMLISCLWYFRINFKHFFSPLSTLILFIFTFVYAIFIINNIHSTTTIAAANFIFRNRIWRSREIQNQNLQTSTTTINGGGDLD